MLEREWKITEDEKPKCRTLYVDSWELRAESCNRSDNGGILVSSEMENISSFQSYRHYWTAENVISRSPAKLRKVCRSAVDWMRTASLERSEILLSICKLEQPEGANDLTEPKDHKIIGIGIWLTFENLFQEPLKVCIIVWNLIRSWLFHFQTSTARIFNGEDLTNILMPYAESWQVLSVNDYLNCNCLHRHIWNFWLFCCCSTASWRVTNDDHKPKPQMDARNSVQL